MLLTRGKRKGEYVSLHQFANDWVNVTTRDGRALIVSPLSLWLDPGEYSLFLSGDPADAGTFHMKYMLNQATGCFRRRPRGPR